MASSINKVELLGNLTADPELKYTPQGTAVVKFTIATNRHWKDRNTGEAKDVPEFTDCVAWEKLAEIISQFMSKGKKMFAEGRLQSRLWEAKDGTKRKTVEVVVDNVVFLTPKAAGTTTAKPVEEGTVVVDDPIMGAAPMDVVDNEALAEGFEAFIKEKEKEGVKQPIAEDPQNPGATKPQ